MPEAYDLICEAGDMLADMVGMLLTDEIELDDDAVAAVRDGIVAWHNMRRIANGC